MRPAIISPWVLPMLLRLPVVTTWTIMAWVLLGAAYWQGNVLCRMQDGYPILMVVGNVVVVAPALPPV